jgi:hypothetical protein
MQLNVGVRRSFKTPFLERGSLHLLPQRPAQVRHIRDVYVDARVPDSYKDEGPPKTKDENTIPPSARTTPQHKSEGRQLHD